MKSLPRILVYTFGAISVLPCLAAAVLWYLGTHGSPDVYIGKGYWLFLASNRCTLGYDPNFSDPTTTWFKATALDYDYTTMFFLACLPLLIWLFIAGMKWVARAVVSFPVPSTRCASCGYDLRATPQRCPECGAIPKLQPPQPAQ